MASYEELLRDDQFIRDSYAALKALGEKPENFTTRKQIVDEILKEQRYFQNNAIAAIDVANDIDKMDTSTREAFSRSLNQLDQMPSFFQKGGSSFWSGVVDHTLSTLSDPINAAGALAGAATFGAGTAASIASRATARQSTMNYLKNKLKTAVTDPAVLKAAATDAGITSVGGFARSAYMQKEIDVELKRQEKVDFSKAAVDGLIEGPVSVLLGGGISAGAGVTFKSLDTVLDKTFQKFEKEGEFKGHRYEWLKSFLMPPSARDEVSLRLLEEQKNNIKGYETLARDLGEELDSNIKNSYEGNLEDGTLQVNLVLAGKAKLESLRGKELQANVSKAIDLIKETQEYAYKTPSLRNKFRALFHQWANDDPEAPNYTRDIYEIHAVSKRTTSFEEFMENNKGLYNEIIEFIQTEDGQAWYRQVLNETTRKTLAKKGINETSFTGTNRLQAAKELAKLEYEPRKGGFKNDAVTNKKLNEQILPEWQKTIWGVNYSPSQRILESVSGILSTVDAIRFAGDLSESFVSRGLAVKAPARVTTVDGQKVVSEKSKVERVKDAFLERNQNDITAKEQELLALNNFDNLTKAQQEAITKRLGGRSPQNRAIELDAELNGLKAERVELNSLDPETDFVRVIGSTTAKDKYGKTKDSLIQTDGRRHSSSAKDFYITRRTYAKHKPLVRDYNNLQNGIASLVTGAARTGLQGAARIQGTLKIGKTVYSPLGHLRNILGATQAVIGAGNSAKAIEAMTQYFSMSAADQKKALEAAERAGVMRSSVDLQQSLTRLGRDIHEDPGLIEKIGTFGLAGTKAGRAAMKFYGATDDVAKFITYTAERNRLKALWDAPDADSAWKLRKATELAEAFDQRGRQQNPLARFDARLKFLKNLEERGVVVSGEAQERLFAPFRTRERFFSKGSGGKTQRTLDNINADDVINELAAQKTLNIMPVYTRVPPVLEALAGIPVIGNFTAYQTEVFRNVYKLYRTSAQELYEGYSLGADTSTGARLIASGLNRQVALTATASFPYALAQYYNQSEETESTVESLRSFVPPWHKYGALVLESVDPTGGKIKYLDFAYTNPYQPVVSTFAPLMAGIANGEDFETLVTENTMHAARTFLDPYIDQSLATQAVSSFYNMVTGQGDLARNTKNFSNAILPGVIKQGIDVGWKLGELPNAVENLMYPTAFGGSKRRNPPRSFSELGNILQEQGYFIPPGLKTFELDLKTQTGYAIKTATKAYREDYNHISRKLKRDLTGVRPITNAETILEDYGDAMESQYIAQQALSEIYTDLSNIIGKRKARKMLLSKDLENATPAKKALYSILREAPRSRLTTLSNNKQFWKGVYLSPAGRKRNISAWRQALRNVERKYNSKDLRKDPVED